MKITARSGFADITLSPPAFFVKAYKLRAATRKYDYTIHITGCVEVNLKEEELKLLRDALANPQKWGGKEEDE